MTHAEFHACCRLAPGIAPSRCPEEPVPVETVADRRIGAAGPIARTITIHDCPCGRTMSISDEGAEPPGVLGTILNDYPTEPSDPPEFAPAARELVAGLAEHFRAPGRPGG